jgi:DNA invertase Pin-like site-specific DNA recombinase
VTEGSPVVGYVRVSTVEQSENGGSLDAQEAAITAECERRGWVLLRIERDVQSGKTMNGRPGLERALRVCRSGEAAGIVVAKLDRVSRSVIDFAKLLEEARKRGFNIVALDLGLDLSTPQGELVANVIASVAQWERRIIGQRTAEGLAAKRAQGVKLGRPRTLPESVRRRIKRMHERGMSMTAIADKLTADGVATAHGGRRWYASTVRSVLKAS